MISNIKENNDRFFVITYYLSDDTVSVYELMIRNSGFMVRRLNYVISVGRTNKKNIVFREVNS